jgi:hypothetical protein
LKLSKFQNKYTVRNVCMHSIYAWLQRQIFNFMYIFRTNSLRENLWWHIEQIYWTFDDALMYNYHKEWKLETDEWFCKFNTENSFYLFIIWHNEYNIQIMNVCECNAWSEYFHEVKVKKYFQKKWKIIFMKTIFSWWECFQEVKSFTSWKYSYHCTHKSIHYLFYIKAK